MKSQDVGVQINIYASLADPIDVYLLIVSNRLEKMLSQSFYLLGDAPASARTIEANENASLDDLKDLVASHFAIVVAEGKLLDILWKRNI